MKGKRCANFSRNHFHDRRKDKILSRPALLPAILAASPKVPKLSNVLREPVRLGTRPGILQRNKEQV
jgi:hypothetical protein